MHLKGITILSALGTWAYKSAGPEVLGRLQEIPSQTRRVLLGFNIHLSEIYLLLIS